ncbi:glycosyltransferase family 2 protein [Patescibacteria group bacterium]|nr:glycosyltransferase family 2 protein [Patescibacteria group bacterium]
MKKISFVIPCFNEELNLENAYKTLLRVTKQIPKYSYEFVFVDNGSSDNSRDIISKIVRKDRRVTGIFLSRNFGAEASAQAGYDQATGEAIIGFAADLQDPPDLIKEFIKRWEKGYQVVVGVYKKIDDYFITIFFRKLFYKIFKLISNIEIPVNASGYGLMDKKVQQAIKSLPEKYRFFRGLRAWVGFDTAYVLYDRPKRKKGKSSYNILDYFKHAERGVFGFSYLLLDLMAYFGFILVILSFLFIILYILISIIYGNPIKGAVTILVSIVFFGGIQLLAISIIGKYIQVIVEETKARPTYIIDKIIGNKNK